MLQSNLQFAKIWIAHPPQLDLMCLVIGLWMKGLACGHMQRQEWTYHVGGFSLKGCFLVHNPLMVSPYRRTVCITERWAGPVLLLTKQKMSHNLVDHHNFPLPLHLWAIHYIFGPAFSWWLTPSNRLSSFQSFYLPGSVDANDEQMDQWNLKPPVLYLWSHPDWTPHHMAIAVEQGHTCKVQEELFINQVEKQFSDQWWEDHDFDDDMDISDDDLGVKNYQAKRYAETRTVVTEQHTGTSLPNYNTCHHVEGYDDHGDTKKTKHNGKRARTGDQNDFTRPHAGVMLCGETLSLSEGTVSRSLWQGGPFEASMTQQYGPPWHNELNYLGQWSGNVNPPSFSFGLYHAAGSPNPNTTSVTQPYAFAPQLPQMGSSSILATPGPWSAASCPYPHQSSSGWHGKWCRCQRCWNSFHCRVHCCKYTHVQMIILLPIKKKVHFVRM